jgi:ribosomal protein S20
MSVTSISSSADPYQTGGVQASMLQTVRSDFKQLKDALTSGSLDQAQQAFNTLQSDLPSGVSSNSPFGQALDAVGQALKSGDVSSAQQALAAIQQRAQGAHHHHHHHHAQGQDASGASGAAMQTDNGQCTGVGTIVNVSA